MSAHSPTIFHSLFAGSVSGMASIAVCHPFDVLRTKMQLNPHLSIATVFQSDMKNGVMSFYKGITGPFFAQALYKSVIFASNTVCHRYVFSDVYNSFTIFCSGTIAGTVNSLIVAPVEIVRTRQIIESQSQAKSTSYLTAIQENYMRNGMKGFWISLVPTIVRDGPGMGVYMLSFDCTKRTLLSFYSPPSYAKDNHPTAVPLWIRLVSGGTAGIAYWTWALPVDSIKTLIESRKAEFTIRSIRQHLNFQHLYKALPIAYLRGIPSAAVTLSVYEVVVDGLQKSVA
jgi:solute carrier family 25 carnitine/acylcarnitine transporter 20/29